jgi:hypothetical protein
MIKQMIAMLSFTGCVLQPAQPIARGPGGPSMAAGGPSMAAGGPSMAGGPIQAGCSLHGNDLPNHAPGMAYAVTCPANCAASAPSIWGSGPYTSDSPLCAAAVHAGAMADAQGGSFQVLIDQGQPAYRGSVSNNVLTADYGPYRESIIIRLADGSVPTSASAAPAGTSPIAQIGCSFTANDLRAHAPGMQYRVECPSGCLAQPRSVWGADAYTTDSPVCLAAIHAGVIADRGGGLTVTIAPGQPAYRGSQRNGVRSSDYGAYRESYVVSR